MALDFDAPDDFGGDSQFLSDPGKYHCLVQSVTQGATPKGTAIDGFCVTFEVLGGEVEGQKGKTINVTYFDPKITDSDKKVKLTKQQRSKFFLATNLLDPSRKGQSVRIELEKAVDQQVVARFEIDDYHSKDGKTYLRIGNAELDIWHIDDPNARTCPKNEQALALIPAALRRKPEFFDLIYAKKQAAAASSKPATAAAAAAGATAGAAAGTSAGRVNLDDL